MTSTPSILCTKTFARRLRLVLGIAVLGLAVAGARAQVESPLYVGNLVSVLDPFGRPMAGSNLQSEADRRSRVEIRQVLNGLVHAPDASGEAHEDNPLLTPESIGGIGMNTFSTNSGLFAMVFSRRPDPGTRIFARVYNAPTVEEASFYADTYVAMTPASRNVSSVVLTFREVQPLDPADDDGDGLSNSWEKLLGTDPNLADTDGDGMSDHQEFLAGTDPLNADSVLAFRSIQDESGLSKQTNGETTSRAMRIRFQSVPGKTYQVQWAPSLSGEIPFEDDGDPVTAADGQTEIDLILPLRGDASMGIFRVVVP